MKIYRSAHDKKLTGLCGGLGEALGVDATLLRIVAIVLAVVTSGGFILVYILASLVVPKEPPYYNPYRGPGGYGGGYPPGGGGYWNPPHGGWRNPGNGPGAPGGDPGYGNGPGYGARPHYQSPPPNPNDLDAMMDGSREEGAPQGDRRSESQNSQA